MVQHNNKPKPDDRSDNVEKLQSMIENTLHNMEEAKDTMKRSPDFEKQKIREKNHRREEAIEGMRDEIKDEYHDQ